MSGTASVPNTFASAVTATGAQLDANYATIVAYINDPTNRNNYAADTGTTNTVAISFAPAVAGYTAGLEITFKANIANSGAVVLNCNSLGNKNLFSPAGVALAGGEITSGQMVSAAYDGTQFQMISQAQNIVAASAGTVSAALSNSTFVTPGRMKNHPGVPKALAQWTGTSTGTITANFAFNVASIVRQGTGTYQITFTTPFADANYIVAGSTNGASSFVRVGAQGAGTVTVVVTTGQAPIDATVDGIAVWGNQ